MTFDQRTNRLKLFSFRIYVPSYNFNHSFPSSRDYKMNYCQIVDKGHLYEFQIAMLKKRRFQLETGHSQVSFLDQLLFAVCFIQADFFEIFLSKRFWHTKLWNTHFYLKSIHFSLSFRLLLDTADEDADIATAKANDLNAGEN